MKLAKRSEIRVVFSAPKKLVSLCGLHDRDGKPKGCNKKHRTVFVPCIICVVYRIPLSCGKEYIGQTGRCLNDRLREHCNNVKNGQGSWLAIHCKSCGCAPIFNACTVIKRMFDKLTREIIEAEAIASLGSKCVSTPSLTLSDKELYFLRN